MCFENFNPSAIVIGTESTVTFGEGTILRMSSDQTLTVPLFIDGAVTLDGCGYELQLLEGVGITLAVDAGLTCKNLTVKDLRNTYGVTLLGDSSFIVYDNSRVVLAEDVSFIKGSLCVRNSLSISGAHGFTYASNTAAVIYGAAELVVDRGATFIYAPQAGSKTLLTFETKQGALVLQQSVLRVGTAGMSMLGGVLRVRGSGTVECLGADAAHGLALGDGISFENNSVLFPEAGCVIRLERGVVSLLDAAPEISLPEV